MSDPLNDVVAWCRRTSAGLTEIADGVGVLAGRVARDWSDAEGALRADRLSMVHRSLLRAADDVAGLGARMDRATAVAAPAGDLVALLVRLAAIGAALGGQPGQRGGITLADVDGERAVTPPGMRLPDTGGS
ncbi:MAG: hypothetical protein L0H84_14115 [Pseudonocardia sp.]|nr:hypothetical protein [Pseudonocardia sp.]